MKSAILWSMGQDHRREKYRQMRQLLNEKQARQYLALEAKERGNIVLVAREAEVSKNTIKAGRQALEAGEQFIPGKGFEGKVEGEKSRRSTILACRPIWKGCWSPKAIR